MDKSFLLKFNAAIEGSFNNLLNHLLIIDKNFVVDTYFIEEACCSNSFIQMREDIRNVLHEEMLGFHIVEAKKSKVLID